MSATGRGGTRKRRDHYATPAWCVRRLLQAANLPGGVWLEPCAGDGAIIDAVEAVRKDVHWIACEVDKRRADALGTKVSASVVMAGDFLKMPDGEFSDATVVITNPPYKLAQQFIERSLAVAPNAWIVMLLRVNFLAGGKRADFMRDRTPSIYVLPNRPSFTGGGTDATEYAWFSWPPSAITRDTGFLRVLASTPAEERGVRRVRRRAA